MKSNTDFMGPPPDFYARYSSPNKLKRLIFMYERLNKNFLSGISWKYSSVRPKVLVLLPLSIIITDRFVSVIRHQSLVYINAVVIVSLISDNVYKGAYFMTVQFQVSKQLLG